MKWIKSGIFSLVILSVIEAAPTPFIDVGSDLLPETSVPIHYDLKLSLRVAGSQPISGVVKIQIQIKEDTNVITLHSRNLAIENIILMGAGSETLDQTHSLEADKDFLLIQVSSRTLRKDEKVSVEITFTGSFQTQFSGIYRTFYKVNDSPR